MAKITLADGMTIEGTAEELRELAKAFGEVAEATEEAQAPDETPETVSTGNVGDIIKITKVGKATVLPTGEYEIIGFDREYYVVYNNGEKEHVKRDADESSYTYEIIPKWAEESEEATEVEVGDIVRNEGVLYEVIGVREPGYLESEEGVTLKDPENPSEKSWKFARNCEIVAKASDRKDV